MRSVPAPDQVLKVQRSAAVRNSCNAAVVLAGIPRVATGRAVTSGMASASRSVTRKPFIWWRRCFG